jgi:hypothetical protein
MLQRRTRSASWHPRLPLVGSGGPGLCLLGLPVLPGMDLCQWECLAALPMDFYWPAAGAAPVAAVAFKASVTVCGRRAWEHLLLLRGGDMEVNPGPTVFADYPGQLRPSLIAAMPAALPSMPGDMYLPLCPCSTGGLSRRDLLSCWAQHAPRAGCTVLRTAQARRSLSSMPQQRMLLSRRRRPMGACTPISLPCNRQMSGCPAGSHTHQAGGRQPPPWPWTG